MDVNYQSLKSRQRAERNSYSENLGLRVHRALSWLNKAGQMEGDQDSQFVFYWIAFNAAYSNIIDDHQRYSEQDTFRNFIDRLCELDNQERLSNLVWKEFTSSIRVLLNNKFVFQPFWDFHNQKKTEQKNKRGQ